MIPIDTSYGDFYSLTLIFTGITGVIAVGFSQYWMLKLFIALAYICTIWAVVDLIFRSITQ